MKHSDRGPRRAKALGVPLLWGALSACTGVIDDPNSTSGNVNGDPPQTVPERGQGGSNSASTFGGAMGHGASANAGSGVANGGTVSSSGSGGSGASSSASAGSTACTAEPNPGASPLRRLTRAQYLNTLRDLFGTLPDLSDVLTRSPVASTVGASQGDISQVEVDDAERAAESVAAAAVAGAALDAVAPCKSGAKLRDCARAFVTSFGARAYRAPLTDAADIERHLALFDVGASVDYRHGIEVLLRGMLQSTRFLYQVELGTSDYVSKGVVSLSGYEVASRLAYAFWNTSPDAALMQAAANGSLNSAAGVASELGRLLSDARGKASLERFLGALIRLDALDAAVKSPTLFPSWSQANLRAALTAQSNAFFADVLQNRGAKLAELLTSTSVFVNRDLGSYYGVSAGAAFQKLELDRARAAGLLTLPAFLALNSKPDESSPIYRGKFVREVLLCQGLPAPPANVPKAPTVEAGVSTRERLRQHEVDSACNGCHRLIDPIGLGFEHFDAIGRYRDTDGDQPVDAHGEVVGTADLDGPFDGVRELAERLASSREVESCVTRQWFRFVLNRFDESADACSIERMVSAFRAAGANLKALPNAVIETDAFRYRRAIDPNAP